jgi:hypothetical protein
MKLEKRKFDLIWMNLFEFITSNWNSKKNTLFSQKKIRNKIIKINIEIN